MGKDTIHIPDELMRNAHYNVYPRYTVGSPAMVGREIAIRVALQEKRSINYRLLGHAGDEKRDQAERWGLRGISEATVDKGRKGWLVFDLITGERYMRPNPEKMRRDGWCTWDELPEVQQFMFAGQKPPHTSRRHWFKCKLARNRYSGNINWALTQWEPQIIDVSDNSIDSTPDVI